MMTLNQRASVCAISAELPDTLDDKRDHNKDYRRRAKTQDDRETVVSTDK